MRQCLLLNAAMSLIVCGNVSYCMRPCLLMYPTCNVSNCIRPCLLLFAAMSLTVATMLPYCVQACFLIVLINSACKQHGSSMMSIHDPGLYASMSFRVPSSKLGLSQPHSRQRVCPFPQNQRGGGHTRLRDRGWRSPNSNDWRKA